MFFRFYLEDKKKEWIKRGIIAFIALVVTGKPLEYWCWNTYEIIFLGNILKIAQKEILRYVWASEPVRKSQVVRNTEVSLMNFMWACIRDVLKNKHRWCLYNGGFIGTYRLKQGNGSPVSVLWSIFPAWWYFCQMARDYLMWSEQRLGTQTTFSCCVQKVAWLPLGYCIVLVHTYVRKTRVFCRKTRRTSRKVNEWS